MEGIYWWIIIKSIFDMYFSGAQSERKYKFRYCILAILNIFALWPAFSGVHFINMLVEKRKAKMSQYFEWFNKMSILMEVCCVNVQFDASAHCTINPNYRGRFFENWCWPYSALQWYNGFGKEWLIWQLKSFQSFVAAILRHFDIMIAKIYSNRLM